MASLAEIRAKHPEYDDLDDQKLADGLYQKFYADMPRDQFYNSIGLKPAPTAPASALPAEQMNTKQPNPSRNFIEKAADFVTGDDRRQPGVGEIHAEQFVNAVNPGDMAYKAVTDPKTMALFLDKNPLHQAAILRQTVPGIQFRRDEYGQAQVRAPDTAKGEGAYGPWMYINRPGLSGNDVQNFSDDFQKFIGTLGAGGAFKKFLPRALAAGGAGALTETVAQAGAMPEGGQGPDAGDVTLAGLASALGQAGGDVLDAGVQAGKALWRRAFKPPAPPGPSTTLGSIGAQAGKTLKELADAKAASSTTRDATAQAAYDQADRHGVPLTRGQASGDARLRQDEDAMLRGGSSKGAQQTMQQFADRQADAIKDAATAIPTRGQTPLSQSMEDAGQAFKSAVGDRRDALETIADDAYKTAFEAGKAETVPPSDELGQRVAALVDEHFFDAPAAEKVITRLQTQIAQGKANFGTVERARQALNRIQTSAVNAKDGQTAEATRQIKQTLDEWTRNTMQSPDARQAFAGARDAFSELKSLYGAEGPRDLGGKAIEKVLDTDRTGQQIAEGILGTGNRPPAQTLATVKRVVQMATETRLDGRLAARPGATAGARRFAGDALQPTDELQALREATFQRVLAPLDKREPGNLVPAKTLLTNIDALLDGPNAAIAQELYTPQEIAKLRELREVIARIVPPPGTAVSGTPIVLWQMAENLMNALSFGTYKVVKVPIEDAAATAGARAAISRPTLFIRFPATAGGPATAAFADSAQSGSGQGDYSAPEAPAAPAPAAAPPAAPAQTPDQRLPGEPVKATTLSPLEEQSYRAWLQQIGMTKANGFAIDDNFTGTDYDLRGFFKKYGPVKVNVAGGQHFTDEFKLPNHETFSDQSIYARGANAARAGHWDGERYVPAQRR
jgi:hypothetical protein